jgi:AraC-like DNA-binding protein
MIFDMPADLTATVRLPLHTWAALRLELLWIYGRPVAARHRRQEMDTRYGQRLWLLRRGKVRVTTAGGAWEAKAGDWLFLPAAKGEQTFSDDAEILSVAFLCQWADGANLFAGAEGRVARARDWPGLERAAVKLLRGVKRRFPQADLEFERLDAPLAEFLWLQQAMLAWVEAWAAVQFALGRALARTLPLDERLAKAVRCLNETPEAGPLPRARLRKETGLGVAQLDRLFAKTYGVTVRRYHEGRRVERARRLLDAPDVPVKTVGYALGFRHAAHFTLWFTRHAVHTPSAWRARQEPAFARASQGKE